MLVETEKKDLIYRLDGQSLSLEQEEQIHHSSASKVELASTVEPESSSSASATAINEETGEINWDCPCLQAAIAPPCGEAFKAAFTCFVASKTEPKGSDCLGFFSAMQDCYRAHPEIYMKDVEDTDGKTGDDLDVSTVDADAAEKVLLIDDSSN